MLIGTLIKCWDLFYSENFVRFKTQTQYKTKTGGLFSLVIIGLFLFIFFTEVEQTFARSNVESNSDPIQKAQPIILSDSSRIAIGMDGIYDLSYYFNPFLKMKTVVKGLPVESLTFQLQACKEKDWQKFNLYYNMTTWLCLPQNENFSINGNNLDKAKSSLEIVIKKCDNTSGKACASQQEIDNYLSTRDQKFSLKVLYIDTTIDANQPISYIQPQLQQRQYFFSYVVGIWADIYFAHYEVETDKTILPYHKLDTEEGYTVDDILSSQLAYPVSSDTLVKITFKKSNNSIKYERRYQKIGDVISYLGGLFGIYLVFFKLMSYYNLFCYTLSIAYQLYHHSKKERQVVQSFNFLTFIGVSFYRLAKTLQSICSCCRNINKVNMQNQNERQLQPDIRIDKNNEKTDDISFTQKMRLILQSKETMQQLLNIDQILNRIRVLQQRTFKCLYKSEKYNQLLQQKKPEFRTAKKDFQLSSNKKKQNHNNQPHVAEFNQIILQNIQARNQDESINRRGREQILQQIQIAANQSNVHFSLQNN